MTTLTQQIAARAAQAAATAKEAAEDVYCSLLKRRDTPQDGDAALLVEMCNKLGFDLAQFDTDAQIVATIEREMVGVRLQAKDEVADKKAAAKIKSLRAKMPQLIDKSPASAEIKGKLEAQIAQVTRERGCSLTRYIHAREFVQRGFRELKEKHWYVGRMFQI